MNESISKGLPRRSVLIGLAGLALAGCNSRSRVLSSPVVSLAHSVPLPSSSLAVRPAMYDAMPGERFPIPAVDVTQVEERFWRTTVDNPTGEAPGTLVVDTPAKYLYFTIPGGLAVRYGIGVGREGFAWSGRAKVQYKREWPRWTPPNEMVARQPELEPYSIANGGMEPGLKNPLGARALYIFQDGRDTLYRLHGTPEAWSIGKAVSSGCIRLLNQDVIDLYERVPDGTPIRVIQDTSFQAAA
ncbi:L,D-transpeptidase family protein [Aurantimonas aggregata]|uniref:L,D-transpeptidase family protein n=1 Tax=Aurantimonas aggregata TaxID=2047720 RepID=A0A6L9MN13_9HYPH|nr:L,D-transpeptidase [Aurantimonas aggregata]NDV89344.1 L,D-transpeptidase family protein [Aurantimonas aggregata]